MITYLYLIVAITFEMIATTALKQSCQFTRIFPSILTLSSYTLAFYCLSHVLKTLPLGVTYALWSSVAIVIMTVVGALFFKQLPDMPAVIGLTCIIVGVCVIHLWSHTVGH